MYPIDILQFYNRVIVFPMGFTFQKGPSEGSENTSQLLLLPLPKPFCVTHVV